MIILGLGCNQGNRLAHLRHAIHLIKNISPLTVSHHSPIYVSQALLPANAPEDWNKPYLNLALACKTTLTPLALLHEVKEIEKKMGRNPQAATWSPRPIDIDILAFDDVVMESEKLTLPHPHLLQRPFALWPLADLAPLWIYPIPSADEGKTAAELVEVWGSRFSAEAPWQTRQIAQRITAPQLMGIVNITPDSFSDGGEYEHAEQAFNHIIKLIDDGAEIIDIGAESTAPTATALDAKSEWKRLSPLLSLIKEKKQQFFIPPKISIDTRHHEVAREALAMGVDWINDVSGLDDPAMREILLDANVDCVVMHHLQIPERRTHTLPRSQDPFKTVYEWGEKRIHELVREGFSREKIIFDPGIGFGKMAEQSLLLLKQVERFHQLGTRLLIGHSRKTFLNLLAEKSVKDRDIETMIISLYLREQMVDYLRIHDVALCTRGLKVADALM